MHRSYYSSSIEEFLSNSITEILGSIVSNSQQHEVNEKQKNAWIEQIKILKKQLSFLNFKDGRILFEYTIPRIGKRADNILLYKNLIFVLEFKCGEKNYPRAAIDQVYDYALDLSNFHQESHNRIIIPILICTKAKNKNLKIKLIEGNIVEPICTNGTNLVEIIDKVSQKFSDLKKLESLKWEESNYYPTPTIIEAAQALYNNHSVEEITRADADIINLSETTEEINRIIEWSKENKKKSICFIAGVPGSGKTLVGLNLSIQYANRDEEGGATFLSGNDPLVRVLREALKKDSKKRNKSKGKEAERKITSFIQNIYEFRNDFLNNEKVPSEKIAIFDEAQRAWTHKKIRQFMKDRKGIDNFKFSEPEYLISTMNRHNDWAVIVCLIGDGQEINTGEAGLNEWFDSLERSYPNWNIFTPNLKENNFVSLDQIPEDLEIIERENLWLSTSIRSFRSSLLSEFINSLLEIEIDKSKELFKKVQKSYPIYLTRDIKLAKEWAKKMSKGSERPGLVASSTGGRLKSDGIFVKNKIDVSKWFLEGKDDTRSSYYLEDVVTEFDIQGLEIDYALVAWDADLRFDLKNYKWIYKKIRGGKWININQEEDQKYLKNAYRVLLTRARQGMVIFISEGNSEDPTKQNEFYDGTYEYLKLIGIPEIKSE